VPTLLDANVYFGVQNRCRSRAATAAAAVVQYFTFIVAKLASTSLILFSQLPHRNTIIL
jgi:hypothetical protein